MTLGEKVDWIESLANEVAFGWDDSGCFWRLVMGGRGAGSMLEVCIVKKYTTTEIEEPGFEAADRWEVITNGL